MPSGAVFLATMDAAVKEAIQALTRSREQVFEIVDLSRFEYRRLRTEVEEIKAQTRELVEQVDALEVRARECRQRLAEVSKDFRRYSESDIKKAYEEAEAAQTALMLAREREQVLRKRRDETAQSLRRLETMVGKAEDLVNNVSVALDFLTVNLNKMLPELEELRMRNLMGSRIIMAQEEERKRVSREIHDGPAQAMANVVLHAEICEKLYDSGRPGLKEELTLLKNLVKESLSELRQIIFDLRPMTLDDLGLVPTLHRYLEKYQQAGDFAVVLNIKGREARLGASAEVALFRLVQEALQNVKKHARASQVKITLEYSSAQVVVVIEDNGVGFDVAKIRREAAGKESFGLLSMRERVELLNGSFQIKAAPSSGTRIVASIPFGGGVK
ncbi:MAG: sensor histidine kinase [Syntrophothermus sp.]